MVPVMVILLIAKVQILTMLLVHLALEVSHVLLLKLVVLIRLAQDLGRANKQQLVVLTSLALEKIHAYLLNSVKLI